MKMEMKRLMRMTRLELAKEIERLKKKLEQRVDLVARCPQAGLLWLRLASKQLGQSQTEVVTGLVARAVLRERAVGMRACADELRIALNQTGWGRKRYRL